MRLVLMVVRDERQTVLLRVPENRHVPSRPSVTVLPIRSCSDQACAVRHASDPEETLRAIKGISCAAR